MLILSTEILDFFVWQYYVVWIYTLMPNCITVTCYIEKMTILWWLYKCTVYSSVLKYYATVQCTVYTKSSTEPSL